MAPSGLLRVCCTAAPRSVEDPVGFHSPRKHQQKSALAPQRHGPADRRLSPASNIAAGIPRSGTWPCSRLGTRVRTPPPCLLALLVRLSDIPLLATASQLRIPAGKSCTAGEDRTSHALSIFCTDPGSWIAGRPCMFLIPRPTTSEDATCSPKTIGGLHSWINRNQAGHRCRSSPIPPPLPADEKGWQGQLPVQTGLESSHPTPRKAADQIPMPAKKWHWVNPRRSEGRTSSMLRSSTSPSAMRSQAMRLRSHSAA